MELHGEWYEWVGLGGLILVAAYFAVWATILGKMDEVEDHD